MSTIKTINSGDYQDDSRSDINENFSALNAGKVEKSGDTMSGQLGFSGTDHAGLKVNALTTAQRDALTPANGMIIYNSSVNTFQMYENGAWVSVQSQYVALTAGEALSANDAIYISDSDGLAYKCDADDLTKMNFFGFATNAASGIGQSVNVQHAGIKGGFTSLTIGARYYVSGTAGGVTATAPTNVTNIGVAISATQIKIDEFPTTRTVVFTNTGANTWTKRPGLKYIEVEVVGGGGGGGGGYGNGDGGSGGGAGGYSKKRINASALGATETATVGTGGNAGNTSNPATDGTDGVASSFGAHCSANGGSKGLKSSVTSDPSGGSATGGDENISGQNGEHAIVINSTAYLGKAGNGGSSMKGLGAVGAWGQNGNGLAASAAAGYGSGGGGGWYGNSGNAASAGAQGIIIVKEFY